MQSRLRKQLNRTKNEPKLNERKIPGECVKCLTLSQLNNLEKCSLSSRLLILVGFYRYTKLSFRLNLRRFFIPFCAYTERMSKTIILRYPHLTNVLISAVIQTCIKPHFIANRVHTLEVVECHNLLYRMEHIQQRSKWERNDSLDMNFNMFTCNRKLNRFFFHSVLQKFLPAMMILT